MKPFDLIYNVLALTILAGLFFTSCKEQDDVAPIITLIGSDTVRIPLNSDYVEQGAKVIDETDGDISSAVYIESNVNEDLFGWYRVTYKAVDAAGNEAEPVYRHVRVINSAYEYEGNFQAKETRIYSTDSCSYPVNVLIDSTVNYRIKFQDFACSMGFRVYADLNLQEGIIIIPYQQVGDSSITMTLQGNGSISDTLISVEYSRKIDSLSTTYWQAAFIR